MYRFVLSFLVLTAAAAIPGWTANFTLFREACLQAANDGTCFEQFKRHPHYVPILEHVSYHEGLAYLALIQEHHSDLLKLANRFRENDRLGGPVTFNYGEVGDFSPTTLRYMKVAADLLETFGDLSQMHIVEVGAGYGGQCKIIADACGFASYTIVDLPECNALSRRYLEALGITNVTFVDSDRLDQLQSSYDLLISNYAFSETPKEIQEQYIRKAILPAARGYMICNFSSASSNEASYTMDELLEQLLIADKRGAIEPEVPTTSAENLLITWRPTEEAPVSLDLERSSGGDGERRAAVTYRLSGGRIGDSLLAYFHAKWLAWKYQLPFLAYPFVDVSTFALADRDQSLQGVSFERQVVISSEKQLQEENDLPTLYVVPYFPEYRFESEMLRNSNPPPPEHFRNLPFFQVNWDDPLFKQEVEASLVPKIAVEELSLPADRLTVAVHVRRGGTFDDYASASKGLPLKFPPDEFYIDQIKRVLKLAGDRPLYVYIFTDDLDPEAIANRYAAAVGTPTISWDWSREMPDRTTMWRDFYAMGKFDCLIRPTSNFSIMAAQLGNYSLLITPTRYRVQGETPVIDQVETKFTSWKKNPPSRSLMATMRAWIFGE
jgi:hypothetical protein